jgi:hypothetical protein
MGLPCYRKSGVERHIVAASQYPRNAFTTRDAVSCRIASRHRIARAGGRAGLCNSMDRAAPGRLYYRIANNQSAANRRQAAAPDPMRWTC